MKRNKVDKIEEPKNNIVDLDEYVKSANLEEIKERLIQIYPIGLVPRKEIDKATGGILNPGTMANRDIKGDGIKNAVLINHNICYPIDGIINYLFNLMPAA